MDLMKLAAGMQAIAKQNPHNQEREFIAPMPCHQVIELDGVRINVILTYNEWDSIPIKAWQLSLSRCDYNGLLTDTQAMPIVEALLGKKDVLELTSQMPLIARPDIIRQFTVRIA